METRFDNPKYWVVSSGEAKAINEMETAHLMNTLKMFIQKPLRVQSMLIQDIENSRSTVWQFSQACNAITLSMQNVTSLSLEQLADYAVNSALGQALCRELSSRGVNVENCLTLFKSEGK